MYLLFILISMFTFYSNLYVYFYSNLLFFRLSIYLLLIFIIHCGKKERKTTKKTVIYYSMKIVSNRIN